MGVNAKARREQKTAARTMARPKVYLDLPDVFLDATGGPWSQMQLDRSIKELDLAAVLMHTTRAAPVRTGADAQHALDVFQTIKAAPDEYIEFDKADWDWMLAHFREMGHTVWNGVDAAFLVRYLEQNGTTKQPTPEAERMNHAE